VDVSPFKVIQGHPVWYQSKAHMRLPIHSFIHLFVSGNMAHRVNTQRDNQTDRQTDRQADRQENDTGVQSVAQKKTVNQLHTRRISHNDKNTTTKERLHIYTHYKPSIRRCNTLLLAHVCHVCENLNRLL